MPKKFVGENSKAAQARARKAAAQEEETAKKQKQIEDEFWKDDDKSLAKKQQKKEDREKKRLEQLQKKAESQALIEQELNSIKKPTGKQPPTKLTRAEIQNETERKNVQPKEPKKNVETHLEQPLEENLNRLTFDGEEARTVNEAINLLSAKGQEVDRHPEKRLRAAFSAYEEANIARIKQENPTLRLSQLKQIMRKEWMKSPDNPLNQLIAN